MLTVRLRALIVLRVTAIPIQVREIVGWLRSGRKRSGKMTGKPGGKRGKAAIADQNAHTSRRSQKRGYATALTDSANRLNRAEMQTKLHKLLKDSQLDASGLNFVSVGDLSVANTPDFESQDPLGSLDEASPGLLSDGSPSKSPLNLSLNKAGAHQLPLPLLQTTDSMSHECVAGVDLAATSKSDPTRPEISLQSPLLQMDEEDDTMDDPVTSPDPSNAKPSDPTLADNSLLVMAAEGDSTQTFDHPISVSFTGQLRSNPITSSSAVNDVTDWKGMYEQVEAENRDLKVRNEKAEADNQELNEKLKKLRKKLAMVEEQKLSSDDLALRYSKKLLAIEDQQKIPMARFTTAPEFNVTVQQLDEMNERSPTDSMFVGLLCIQLIGVDRLKGMSVTGQPSHRFINAMAADGSPICKPTEKMDPAVVSFIRDKVAERTAMRVGPENVATIRKRSDEKPINRYIATKISNLKKNSNKPQT